MVSVWQISLVPFPVRHAFAFDKFFELFQDLTSKSFALKRIIREIRGLRKQEEEKKGGGGLD